MYFHFIIFITIACSHFHCLLSFSFITVALLLIIKASDLQKAHLSKVLFVPSSLLSHFPFSLFHLFLFLSLSFTRSVSLSLISCVFALTSLKSHLNHVIFSFHFHTWYPVFAHFWRHCLRNFALL